MLDTLAEGGEVGTNELARRTGMTPSTMSRQLGTLSLALRSLADANDTTLPSEDERMAGRKTGINTVRFGISTMTTPK